MGKYGNNLTFFHVDRHPVPPFASLHRPVIVCQRLRHFRQKREIPSAKIAQNSRNFESKPVTVKATHTRDARPAKNRVRILLLAIQRQRDVGGVWDWDIGNGNAILLEADAGDIRVIDHMDHLVDVR